MTSFYLVTSFEHLDQTSHIYLPHKPFFIVEGLGKVDRMTNNRHRRPIFDFRPDSHDIITLAYYKTESD